MSLDPAKLEALLRAGDVAGVVTFFAGASETDRERCAARVLAWSRLLDLNREARYNDRARRELAGQETIGDVLELMPAADAAALACASLPEIEKLGSIATPAKIMVAILADRRPPWLDAFAEFLCGPELRRVFGSSWRQARALVRAGLCRPPASPNYALAALEGIHFDDDLVARRREAHLNGTPFPPDPALVDLLLAESDWLETTFWRLFEIEGTGEVSLANADKYGRKRAEGWSATLVELARRGVLPRDRLLDASLAALGRDFIRFRAGWFSRFHEALEPTPTERAARVDPYLNLIASSVPPTIAFAVAAVAIADEAAPLPANKLLFALAPALAAPGKTVAAAALGLLDRVATREPAAKTEACLLATAALLNEAVDVQKHTFDLLERHAASDDTALRARVAEVAGAVAASLRPRLSSWLGQAASVSRPPKVAAATTASSPPAATRTAPSRALGPVTTLDDLIDFAARVLETPDSPDDIERVLDGISRLCDQRPPDFERRTGPLRKRALKWRDRPPSGWSTDPGLVRALAMVVLSWLERASSFTETPEVLAGGENELAFLFRRLEVLARQAATGQARPLLSAPTHAGGWIDPRTLVERWLAWQKADGEAAPDRHEQVLALLRLAPENRAAALRAASAVKGEAGRALRHALGKTAKPERDSALWLAAARSAQPVGDLDLFEHVHPRLGPDAGRSAEYAWTPAAHRHPSGDANWTQLTCDVRVTPKCPMRVAECLLPVLFHRGGDDSYHGATPRALIRWAAQLWPANREALFARGVAPLTTATFWAEVGDRETIGYLEPLTEPHPPLGPMAALALALGLAAQDASLRGHAQEALIAIVADGRFDAERLGCAMARLFDTGFNKLARWSVSLGEVARVSPAHAQAAAELLIRLLHANPAHAPRDVSALLELLHELLSESGSALDDSTARRYLQALKAGGKTARLAQQLLTLSSHAAPP